jgi:hypothetical protein
LRHPTELGGPEIQAFLSYLANERNVSVSTHHQALCTLLFFYKNVLQIELPWLDNVHRPVKPARRPTVLTRQKLEQVLAQMDGIYLLIQLPVQLDSVAALQAGDDETRIGALPAMFQAGDDRLLECRILL